MTSIRHTLTAMSGDDVRRRAGARPRSPAEVRLSIDCRRDARGRRSLTPTVEAAAAGRSRSSRTTAYSYLPNRRAQDRRRTRLSSAERPRRQLVRTHPADPAAWRSSMPSSAVRSGPGSAPIDTEAQQRTRLRLSLESDVGRIEGSTLRQGRAIAWFAGALEGVHTDSPAPGEAAASSCSASAATVDVDARCWLVDVDRVLRARDGRQALTRWSAQALEDAGALDAAP